MIADGAVVDGKYRIIRCLGGGAMGKVYQAEKVTTHERFAVKFIHDYLLSDDVYLARFEREVNALRGIRHPHVIDLYDWKLPGKGAGGHGYIVMEYLDGESFQQVLQRPAGVSLDEVARVMLQVIDGLTAVHGLGIVHRDLSPANIFLVGRDAAWRSVKILDFGLAKGEAAASASDVDGGVTQDGAVLGRAAYAAPEMFLGADLDERADVFACGMIMYRALARRFPYRESKTDLIWVERYSERYEEGRPYPSARTFNPSIPAVVDQIIGKAIRKRPSERYQKAVDMQADLVSAEAMLAKTPRVDSARPVEMEPPFDPAAGMTATKIDLPPPADGSSTPGAAHGGAMQSVSNWLRGDGSGSAAARLAPRRRLSGRIRASPILARAVAAGILGAGALAVVVALLARSSGDDPRAVEPARSGIAPAAGAGAGDAEPGIVRDPPPPAAEPAPPAAPPPPETVTVRLDGLPGGARATVGGVTVVDGVAVVPRSSRPVAIEAEAPGHRPYSAQVVPSEDAYFQVFMEEVARADLDAGAAGSAAPRPPPAGKQRGRPPRTGPRPVVLDAGAGIGIIVDYDDR